MTVSSKKANARAFPSNGEAIAVVFDFMNPVRPRRYRGFAGRQTRCKLDTAHGSEQNQLLSERAPGLAFHEVSHCLGDLAAFGGDVLQCVRHVL
jgi:hypothetical protein